MSMVYFRASHTCHSMLVLNRLEAFTLEILVKLLAFEFCEFARDLWNWFDTFLASWLLTVVFLLCVCG